MYVQDVTSRTGKAGPPSPILEADVSESTGTAKGHNPSIYPSNFQALSPSGHSKLEVFTRLLTLHGLLLDCFAQVPLELMSMLSIHCKFLA